jgi:hypothetical protein
VLGLAGKSFSGGVKWIWRFDQHYQNFCGFDTLETAQQYLGVFEKVYRFTPFPQSLP